MAVWLCLVRLGVCAGFGWLGFVGSVVGFVAVCGSGVPGGFALVVGWV